METGVSVKSFEDLKCYQKARALRLSLARVVRGFPAGERYRLSDQMLRAARSVTANIAEGFGRHHHTENLPFCRQARGSLTEGLEHLNTALDEEMISKEVDESLRTQIEETWRVLNGYLAYLQRCVTSGVPRNEEHDN